MSGGGGGLEGAVWYGSVTKLPQRNNTAHRHTARSSSVRHGRTMRRCCARAQAEQHALVHDEWARDAIARIGEGVVGQRAIDERAVAVRAACGNAWEIPRRVQGMHQAAHREWDLQGQQPIQAGVVAWLCRRPCGDGGTSWARAEGE